MMMIIKQEMSRLFPEWWLWWLMMMMAAIHLAKWIGAKKVIIKIKHHQPHHP